MIAVCLLLTAVPMAVGEQGNVTAHAPANNTTATLTPTPTALPTPTPIPAPRQVFFNAKWDIDHISIQVNNNNGPAITVETYIDTLSNKNIVPIDAGASKLVSTLPISAENGQIIRYWFKAYENGTLIDSMEGSITVVSTVASPTVPPETGIVSGMISDSVTGAPINGAEVIFTSKSFGKEYPHAYTDASGTFTTIGKMYPDNYYVTVKANGYKTLTSLEVSVASGAQQISDPVKIEKVDGGKPTTMPSPTPGSFIDAWAALLYNPTTCIGTLAVGLGAIVSATAVYEWMMRQRERRKKEDEKKP